MASVDKVSYQLERIGFSGWTANHAGFESLPEILRDNEIIEAAIVGKYEGRQGVAVATDQRLLFVSAAIMFGRKLRIEDFPYTSITSVQVKHGHIFGEVEVFSSGNKAKIEGVSSGGHTAGNEAATIFAEYVKQKVYEAKNPPRQEPAPNVVAPFDLTSQLERLAALRDRGVLTEEEFQAQKQKYLNM